MPLFQRSIPIRREPFDAIPEVREPEAGTDFLPPDTERTAVIPHERDLLEVLEGIEENTRKPRSEGIIWEQRNVRLPMGAGESSVVIAEPVRYLYVPNVPRVVEVYAGQSRGVFLGRLDVGETLKVRLPFLVNGVFLDYAEGGENEQINVFFSSSEISISITSGGLGRTAVWA